MARPKTRTLVQTKEGRDWLVWLDENYCKHGHPYSVHFNCYQKEHPGGVIQEKVGFLDIEATNLKADFGIVICYCIKPNRADKIIERCITQRELRTCLDKKVVQQCIDDMLKFDRIVWHYGSRFDGGFLRARALKLDLHFPEYKQIWQTDTWRIARQKLTISSNRLDRIATQCNVAEKKTPITPEHWLGALQGKKESLEYILQHCRLDVLILEKVYNKIWKFSPRAKTSI